VFGVRIFLPENSTCMFDVMLLFSKLGCLNSQLVIVVINGIINICYTNEMDISIKSYVLRV
jgi:hypothetical protein